MQQDKIKFWYIYYTTFFYNPKNIDNLQSWAKYFGSHSVTSLPLSWIKYKAHSPAVVNQL